MTEALAVYFHKLMDTGFPYIGTLENPSISLENLGQISPVCGNSDDYTALYVSVRSNMIDDIKYVCLNDPTTNVALDMLCVLMKGKTLDEAADLTDDAFCQLLGSEDELLRQKASVLLTALNSKILEYRAR